MNTKLGLIFLAFYSFSLFGMEEDVAKIRRNISLIEAYMGPNFEFEEDLLIFPDYNNGIKHTLLLPEAARLLYQFRRDRCDVHAFRTGLVTLFLNLKADPFKDLSEQEKQTFQLWRLYRFDFFEKDVDEVKYGMLRKSADNTRDKSGTFQHASMALERSQKLQKEHETLLATLPAQCNIVKANRVAYSSAFSMASIELLKTQATSLLRLKPLTPLNESLKALQSLAQKKGNNNPFELQEL